MKIKLHIPSIISNEESVVLYDHILDWSYNPGNETLHLIYDARYGYREIDIKGVKYEDIKLVLD